MRVVRRGTQGTFMHVQRAQEHRARIAKPGHDRGIGPGSGIERGRAAGRRHTIDRDVVLHGKGDAIQRPDSGTVGSPLIAGRCRRARARRRDTDEGPNGAIPCLDPAEGGLGQRHCGGCAVGK